MQIQKHLDKNNLHHAYLIEGEHKEIVPEILEFLENVGIKVRGNPDFCQIHIDNFKIDEALSLRSMSSDKNFTVAKKIFIICASTFSLDAQQALLKMFEEPIANTHFFLIVPDASALLKTLVSRFYIIKTKRGLEDELQQAETFMAMSIQNRINFIKELLAEEEGAEDGADLEASLPSPRSKALKFLNTLEFTLHQKAMSRMPLDTRVFNQIFKVREFLRQPGSSTKSLMESIALTVPPNLP